MRRYGDDQYKRARGCVAIQDALEGIVVALATRRVGYGRFLAAGIGAASGLIEPVAAVLGAGLMSLSSGVLPWGLAAAAGAMLFVIRHEIIPSRTAKATSRSPC